MSNKFVEKVGKLEALLGVDSAQPVLLVGADLTNWEGDFEGNLRGSLFLPSIPPGKFPCPKDADRWGVIILNASFAGCKNGLGRSLTEARSALDPRGSLILYAENLFSFRTIKRQPERLLSGGTSTSWGWGNKLYCAGFDRVQEFLPLPNLLFPEEFVESRHGPINLTTQFSCVEKSLKALGLLRFFHDGYVYIASMQSGGTHQILDALAGQISIDGEMFEQLLLERFDLRDRGALVLLVRDVKSSRRMVARIATSTEVAEVVGRNALWVEKIWNNDRISFGIKSKVPRHYGSYDIGENRAYVEELVEGVLAWKVAHEKKIQDIVFSGVYEFIRDFNRNTVVRRRVDGSFCEKLIYGDATNAIDKELCDPLSVMQAQLVARLKGNDANLVWAHGDYGYGNAIVDPKTGHLKGIIDWDQAGEDFAGVDLLNFLIQKHRIDTGESLFTSFCEIGNRLMKDGIRSLDERLDYFDVFSISPREIPVLLALVVLRVVFQEARFSGFSEKSNFQFVDVLKEANRFLIETA